MNRVRKNFLRSCLASGILALALSAAGCGTSVNSTERAEPIGSAQNVNDKRIERDWGLKDIAQVVGVREATVSGDLLKIQVDVRNSTRSPQNFNYKFEWYDLEGMQVQTSLTNWANKQIDGKETVTLTGVAPNPRAKDFRLKLIEGK